MKHVFVIAEAGVNHNGSLELAKRLVDEAKMAGADAVKFQVFQAQHLVSRKAAKAEYQKEATGNDETQFEMLKKLELSYENFRTLNDYCQKRNILFLSTAFDKESLDFLEALEIPVHKIPSGEVTNLPYLEQIARTGKPIIMSTGMCELGEVEQAISALKKNGAGKIILLHCNTEYPTPFSDVNLLAMRTLAETFKTDTGYSDHTQGIEVPIAATALGAAVIEKHFTLDRTMEGPDHASSLEPEELKKMIDGIRHIEAALGTGKKRPSVSEAKNIKVARKSIVAKREIKKGDIFSEENITVKRPGTGLSPMRWHDVIGRSADRDYKEDEMIEL